MTTANPEMGSAAKSLYSFDGLNETKSKLPNPTESINLFGRPSLVPGVEYPISDREEELLNKGYDKGQKDALRMNRKGRLVEDDPFLDLLRNRVKQIRKDLVKKGRVEPVTEEERGWLR
jgi:hypothetical protein